MTDLHEIRENPREMDPNRQNLDDLLAVNLPAMFHSDPHRKQAPRFKTQIRGWQKPLTILLDRPRSPNGTFAPLQEGQDCVVRFLREGKACAFNTTVIDWDTRRYNAYVRLRWPEVFSSISFRRFERIKVRSACAINSEEGPVTQGEIHDLSAGGCSIFARRPCGNGDSISLSFELPDGCVIDGLKAIARNPHLSGNGWVFGTEFLPNQERAENDIVFYVMSTLERLRIEGPHRTERRRILVIDDAEETSAQAKRVFEEANWQVFMAGNAVDGFYRLRMSAPAVLAVNQGLTNLSGVELCRLVKGVPGFEELPVFVYGAREPDEERKAAEAGAAGVVPTPLLLVSEVTAFLKSAAPNPAED